MRVLVLDGHENQAVACVRSLARAGHEPWVGAETSWSKAGWSRDCAGSFRYPAPQEDAAGFIAMVAAEASREAGTLVLPMTERTTLPLSAARDRLLQVGSRIVLPPHETVLRAFDKQETTRLARSLGIETPETLVVETESDARRAAHASRYPVVLKPRSSQEYGANQVRTTGAPAYARNAEQFMRAWHDMSLRSSSIVVQPFIEGIGVGYFALTRNGALCSEFQHRRIRDVRPSGSGSSLRVSVAVDARVRAHSLALLEALRWTGVAMVEYRVLPDGVPVFLEVNGRFWNSLALAVHAGRDFPVLLAQLAANGNVAPQPAYRVGVRCRWPLGDVQHLAAVWRGAPAGYPARFPGRFRTLVDVLTPVAGTFHDTFTWRDPLPELGDWLYLLRKITVRPDSALRATAIPRRNTGDNSASGGAKPGTPGTPIPTGAQPVARPFQSGEAGHERAARVE
jgi:predicted ATP-grasp superfamily ATP-dependent carboligase